MDVDFEAEVVSEDEDPRPAGALARSDVSKLVESEHRDRIYDRVVRNIQPIVRFAEVAPGAPNPPDAWVEEYGWEKAQEHFRVAQACYLPTKDVPYGVKATVDLYRGIEAARAKAGEASTQVAVQINMSGNAAGELPVMDIKKVDNGR